MPQENSKRVTPDWMEVLIVVLILSSLFVVLRAVQDGWQSIHSAALISLCIIGLVSVVYITRPQFWREYRWIIISAAVIFVTWIMSMWAQSYLSIENLQSLQIYPPPGTTSAVYATFPRRVLYNTTDVPPLSIWLAPQASGTTTSTVALTSNVPQVVFSLEEGNLRWQSELTFDLPPDGTEKAILLRRPDLPKDLPVILSATAMLTTSNAVTTTSIPIGTVLVEGQESAKHRTLVLGLLQTSSVVVAIIAALFAGFKQVDEQKRNERKKEVDEVIRKIEDFKYERGKVSKFLESSLLELRDWSDWLPEQQADYQNAFLKVINTLEQCTDILEVSSSEPSSWTNPAKQIVAKIQPTGAKAILEQIAQQEQDYSPELEAVHFPPEKYPCHKWFLGQAISPLPQDNLSLGWGIKAWDMKFPPFGDANNPFKYFQGDDFPLLGEVRFPLNGTDHAWFNNQTYHFPTNWDVNAGTYQFSRRFGSLTDDSLRKLSQRTFFVYNRAEEIPLWHELLTFEDYLLHNLAANWLRLLAHMPEIVDKITLAKREAIARMLVWHYGSSAAIQAISLSPDAAILKHFQTTKSDLSLTSSNKTRFLSLRPPGTHNTVFLSAELSSDSLDAMVQTA